MAMGVAGRVFPVVVVVVGVPVVVVGWVVVGVVVAGWVEVVVGGVVVGAVDVVALVPPQAETNSANVRAATARTDNDPFFICIFSLFF
jgi:hypothetical protein